MIVEGLVTMTQGNNKIHLRNHIVGLAAKYLFSMLLGRYYTSSLVENGLGYVVIYLMRSFQIRLGSGTTLIPSASVTDLQTLKCSMSGNTTSIKGDYNIAAPFDMIYAAQISSLDLCSACASNTIFEIVHNVKGIIASPPDTPENGDVYIISPTPSGIWEGHANEVATYNGTSWEYITPVVGFAADVIGTPHVPYEFNGTSWGEITTRIREGGLFTYRYPTSASYRWTVSFSSISTTKYYGNSYQLAAYISANGENPDFNYTDINICLPLIIEWTIRISFAGDE